MTEWLPVSSRVLFTGLVGLVVLERLFELQLSRRNTKRALQVGAVEVGAGHYPVMVILHATFLVAMMAEVWLLGRLPRPFVWQVALAVLVGTMCLRYWVVMTLGDRWTTRVIVRRDDRAVSGGPYRFLRHPNYFAVLFETAALPLVHGAWVTAAVYSFLNALLLRHRIRVEEGALAQYTDWQSRFDTAGRSAQQPPEVTRP